MTVEGPEGSREIEEVTLRDADLPEDANDEAVTEAMEGLLETLLDNCVNCGWEEL